MTRSTSGSRRRRTATVFASLLLVSSGCGEPIVEAEYMEPFAPPPIYRQWWGDLKQCTGLRGDFMEIRWYTGESVTLHGEDLYGLWAAPRTIVVDRFYIRSAAVVKHEMLHHITNGEMRHSHPAFVRCTQNSATVTTP